MNNKIELAFWKMHGAGNDFILFDDRKKVFPCTDVEWIVRISARRTGIGCDGLLLIQPAASADFRMRYFNPDGREVDMCGNGARCIARLARDLGVAGARMKIETSAGLVEAECIGAQVRLRMTEPKDWRMGLSLDVDGRRLAYDFVNSGVPHAVVEVTGLDGFDVQRVGSGVRRHAAFAPKGTNANFIEVTGPDSLRIRTYERGVEAETLACGTGIVASALVAGRNSKVKPPVRVTCAGGDVLVVDYRLTRDGAENVTLLGPAEHVFTGTIAYERAG